MADRPDDQPGAGTGRALWHMLTLAFRADPVRAFAALATSAAQASGSVVGAVLVSRIIQAAVERDLDRAVTLAVVLGVVGAVLLAASLARLDLRFRMEEATTELVDRELIEAVASIPGLAHHELPEHLDRLELLRQQRRMLGGSVGALVENVAVVVSLLATVGALASVDVRLLLLPLLGVPSVYASARVRAAFKDAEERTAERGRLAQHLLQLGTSGPPAKELRLFALGPELRHRYQAAIGAVHDDLDRTSLRATATSTGGWLVFAVGYVGAIFLVLREAAHGRASAADVVLVITLSGQVSDQVGGVYWMVGWLFDTLKTVGRYLRVLDDARSARTAAPDVRQAPAPDRLQHGIDLVAVGFAYPGTERPVLSDVDLHLPAGSTVAVVGDNGAGKSTIVKLLSRFYDPTQGAILVDGVDLRAIPATEWRERMAAGFQDFAKLELLARETVGVGDLPGIDDGALVGAALDRASAADVVADLPLGLDSQVGRQFDGGVELSGGQWQKLALGRAMMRERPLLLVLDEPTAALDADTEHALFERYAGAAREVASETGGITVLVSHRFSTVRMADVIVVVAGGTVAEVGTHAELLARGGTYAELYELQARAYR